MWSSGGMVFSKVANGIYGYRNEWSGSKASDQSGVGNGDLPSDKVLSMAVDQDGELWIRNDEGCGDL